MTSKVAEAPPASIAINDTSASWNDAEQKSFMDACVPNSKMGTEKGTAFCRCMLEKMITLYPKPSDAAGLTKERATELAKECYADTRKGDSTWSAAERTAFLKECSGKAIKSKGIAKTQTYCNCMLGKIEKAYPNPLDAQKMTPEELSAWAKECGQ